MASLFRVTLRLVLTGRRSASNARTSRVFCTADLELQDRFQDGKLGLQLTLLQPEKIVSRDYPRLESTAW